jgi:ankyrin repeat protein
MPGKSGSTALMLSVGNDDSHYEKVELLLAKGADVELKNKEGHTAIMIARKVGSDTLVRLLEKKRK